MGSRVSTERRVRVRFSAAFLAGSLGIAQASEASALGFLLRGFGLANLAPEMRNENQKADHDGDEGRDEDGAGGDVLGGADLRMLLAGDGIAGLLDGGVQSF